MPLAQPILDTGPGQPPIIARQAWARGQAPPRHLPVFATVNLAFVHHSVTANGYGPGQVPGILLSIFAYHVYVRDYWDIAYNFAVDAFGRIWERGRAASTSRSWAPTPAAITPSRPAWSSWATSRMWSPRRPRSVRSARRA